MPRCGRWPPSAAGRPAARRGPEPSRCAGVGGPPPGKCRSMSESFSEPAPGDANDTDETAEPDVGKNEDQVEPADGSEYVGRVAGDDRGYADEQGAEARAAGEAEDAELTD